eukprot:9604184-Alexandrium_andersonii.AAC.1
MTQRLRTARHDCFRGFFADPPARQAQSAGAAPPRRAPKSKAKTKAAAAPKAKAKAKPARKIACRQRVETHAMRCGARPWFRASWQQWCCRAA